MPAKANAGLPVMLREQPEASGGAADIHRFWEQTGSFYLSGRGNDNLADPFIGLSFIPAATGVVLGAVYLLYWAGRVVFGVEVRVTDEDGSVLPNDGESVGEFEIRGPWITASYYLDPDPEKFRDGVSSYLSKYSLSNAASPVDPQITSPPTPAAPCAAAFRPNASRRPFVSLNAPP